MTHAELPPHDAKGLLTSRETDVLQELANGFNNPQIASILQISIGTVKSHTKSIFQKLGARDRTQAVIIGVQSQSLTAMEIPATPEANAETICETLTPRELEVLQAITTGMNNQDIATKFHLSRDTVKTHVKSILLKLRARNRTHAVVCALIAGIVLLPATALIATKIKATKAVAMQQASASKNRVEL